MLDFTIRPDGGDEYEVTATSRDFYVFEKTNKGKSFSQVMENLHMSDMYRVAHLAVKRLQLFTGSLDEFVESVDLILGEDAGDELSDRLEALIAEHDEAQLDAVAVDDLRAVLAKDSGPDPTPPAPSAGD